MILAIAIAFTYLIAGCIGYSVYAYLAGYDRENIDWAEGWMVMLFWPIVLFMITCMEGIPRLVYMLLVNRYGERVKKEDDSYISYAADMASLYVHTSDINVKHIHIWGKNGDSIYIERKGRHYEGEYICR